jgi:hypothetical protein
MPGIERRNGSPCPNSTAARAVGQEIGNSAQKVEPVASPQSGKCATKRGDCAKTRTTSPHTHKFCVRRRQQGPLSASERARVRIPHELPPTKRGFAPRWASVHPATSHQELIYREAGGPPPHKIEISRLQLSTLCFSFPQAPTMGRSYDRPKYGLVRVEVITWL